LVREHSPEIVINCAAHTDVEGAERDPAAAMAANGLLPGLLATACRRQGATLVHVSSTGCYGDWKSGPYGEDDDVRPTTAHHRSKMSGERAVRHGGCEFLILRTGWLFGGRPGQAKNFVWNRLVEARSKPGMLSDPFQHGNPTFVGQVAEQCLVLLGLGIRGTFNCVSGPGTSRLDYVREIVSAAGLPCRVEPSAEPFRRLAAVSPNETAVNGRLDLLGLNRMSPWSEALGRYVRTLMLSPEWIALEAGPGQGVHAS
jgi:dTDP-4-dehydrorhamnose reductase